ncbi:MAG: hypothetical protein JXQ66_03035, partial [Campylobacterales bacterium]|nr:hypothetical protein [Campylobacterales bacterium]
IAHDERDFISQLKLNMSNISQEQEVKLVSFKNYIQKSSKTYYEDVLKPAFSKIDEILGEDL